MKRVRLPLALAITAVVIACCLLDCSTYDAATSGDAGVDAQCDPPTCMTCPPGPAPVNGTCPAGRCLWYPLDQPMGCDRPCNVMCCVDSFSNVPLWDKLICQFDAGAASSDASDVDISDAGTDVSDASADVAHGE